MFAFLSRLDSCMVLLLAIVVFFFFKQKTAYEMRISDWSSDVCSSDLPGAKGPGRPPGARHPRRGPRSADRGRCRRARGVRGAHAVWDPAGRSDRKSVV